MDNDSLHIICTFDWEEWGAHHPQYHFAVRGMSIPSNFAKISENEGELITREYLHILSKILGDPDVGRECRTYDVLWNHCWSRIRHLIASGVLAEWKISILALDIVGVPLQFDSDLALRDIEGEEIE